MSSFLKVFVNMFDKSVTYLCSAICPRANTRSSDNPLGDILYLTLMFSRLKFQQHEFNSRISKFQIQFQKGFLRLSKEIQSGRKLWFVMFSKTENNPKLSAPGWSHDLGFAFPLSNSSSA